MPRLGLPQLVSSYLLYDLELKDDDEEEGDEGEEFGPDKEDSDESLTQ